MMPEDDNVIQAPFGGAPQTNGQSANIKDADMTSFEADVLQASMQKPVVVDFWAPWCEPCKQLMPVLEKLVGETNGAVDLVKVNIDENPQLAQAMQVQSVPTVYAFFRGQPVDGFQGNKPASELKNFIKKIQQIAGGQPADMLSDQIEAYLEKAFEVLSQDDHTTAQGMFLQVLQNDPENIPAKAGIAKCLLAQGENEAATELLGDLPPEADKDQNVISARAALKLQEDSGNTDSDEINALQAKLDKNADDHQSRYDLASALFQSGQHETAVDMLVELIHRDANWNEEAARQKLLTFFESLGNTHPVTTSGRRKLSTVLFS